MAERYVCIHGHFYQPPRENPWLEAVEVQESAYPDHDWNHRITRECYAANGQARILDGEGRITSLANNYERISFNFGPTLLAWMQEFAPESYRAVLEADRATAARFGHGSALAQGYNHAILPLCNDRDRRTQILWGVRDFEARFGRQPDGLWLPEAAVNTATLETLAEFNIRFAVLAPGQAHRIRPIGGDAWNDPGTGIDPSRAYLCRLPSGREITLFFYDGPVSQGVAFEGLLNSGERFAERLLTAFDDARPHAQLAHIATDGESYGHHHRFGEMALAAALDRIEARPEVSLTNYAAFLERHPPEMEVQIHENSSWSCAHGVERWKSDCGCNSGRKDFHQRWRGPLRAALDWLRDSLTPEFERSAGELLNDPWAARDDYIQVVLDRSAPTIERFLKSHAKRDLTPDERVQVLRLMEIQRHAMLMYTSCGWFFDDIAGIETVQCIQYAGRAVQLAREALNVDLDGSFLERLAEAPGNDRSRPDGRAVYEQCVRPAVVDLLRVGAHFAISSLFGSYQNQSRVYSFEVQREDEARRSAGRARLLVGKARLDSRVTLEQKPITYAVLHLGDHVLNCGVRAFRDDASYEALIAAATEAFDRADFADVIRVMDAEFEGAQYSIASLFRDEQQAVIRRILETPLAQIDAAYAQIYEQHAALARFLKSLDLPIPRRIQMVGTVVLTQSIRRLFEEPSPDFDRIRELVTEARQEGIALDAPTIEHAAREALWTAGRHLKAGGDGCEDLERLLALVRVIRVLPFQVDTWPAQESLFAALPVRTEKQQKAAEDAEAGRWLERFDELAREVKVSV